MKCRGCGAEIIWIRMYGSAKMMPVDAWPVSVMYGYGTEKFIRSDGVMITGIRITGDDFDYDAYPEGHVMEAFVSHFATCPSAGKFRKGGGEK